MDLALRVANGVFSVDSLYIIFSVFFLSRYPDIHTPVLSLIKSKNAPRIHNYM